MKRVVVRLKEKRHDYDEVFSYFFVPDEPVAYGAGQYVHFALPLTETDAKPVRELSFASAPHEEFLQFTVDARSQSPFQKHLLSLEEGGEAELFKTNRHMRWPVIEEDVVFIAGGIGVTPFRSMCLDMVRSGVQTKAELIHVARGPFLFEKEFEGVVSEHHTITHEKLSEKLVETIGAKPYARYYVAGSPSFVETVETQLKGAGIEKIETDVFKGYEGE